jgi:hypothetical protein
VAHIHHAKGLFCLPPGDMWQSLKPFPFVIAGWGKGCYSIEATDVIIHRTSHAPFATNYPVPEDNSVTLKDSDVSPHFNELLCCF